MEAFGMKIFGKKKTCNCQACNPKVQPVTREQLINAGVAADLNLTTPAPTMQQTYSRTNAYKTYPDNNGMPFDKAASDALENPQGNYNK